MEHFVGIDVAKERLGVHLRPGGEALAGLVERLRALAPALVVIEATGGYEMVVASSTATSTARSTTARPGRPTPISWPAYPASARRGCAR